MLVNPRKRKGGRKRGKKAGVLGLSGAKGALKGVTGYEIAAGAAGAVVTLVVPKMAPYGWTSGLKGVVTSAIVTVATGAVTYAVTKNMAYSKAVVLGGGIITALRLLKVATRAAGVRPIGLEGAGDAGIPEEELLGLEGIDAYTPDEVKVV